MLRYGRAFGENKFLPFVVNKLAKSNAKYHIALS